MPLQFNQISKNINMDQITCLQVLSYSHLFYDQIKVISFISDHQEHFNLSQKEKDFIKIFMNGFMIKSFSDFESPTNAWRMSLYKNSFDYISNGLLFISYSPDEKNLKFFKETITFQAALLNILNLRPSFSFSIKNVKNSYKNFSQYNQTFSSSEVIDNELYYDREVNVEKSFIKKIFGKFFKSITNVTTTSNLEKLNSLHLLNTLITNSKKNNSNLVLTDRELISKNSNHNVMKLLYETEQYVSSFNKYTQRNMNPNNISMLETWLEDLNVASPCLENLFFTINSLTMHANSETPSTTKFFLNDYFLSDSNRHQKINFLTNFYEKLFHSYSSLEQQPSIPFKMVLNNVYKMNFDENFINQNKKDMCFLLQKESHSPLSPFDPVELFNKLEREQNLLSQLSKKPDIVVHHKKKI